MRISVLLLRPNPYNGGWYERNLTIMKKTVLLLSSVLLFASCGGVSTNPADYAQEPGNAKAISGKDAAAHANKLARNIANQTAFGLEMTGFLDASVSFTTEENKEYKSSASISDLKANAAYVIDGDKASASASASAKVVADVNAIRPVTNQWTGGTTYVDTSAKLDAPFDAKAALQEGTFYYDLTGLADGMKKATEFAKTLTGMDDLKIPEGYFVKGKVDVPSSFAATSIPVTVGSYLAQYSDYLTQLDEMASSSVSGVDYSKFIETKEYGDGTYGVLIQAGVKDVLPLLTGGAEISEDELATLDDVSGSGKILIDFDEKEIKSVGLSVDISTSDFDVLAFGGADLGGLPITKLTASIKAGIKISFSYGDKVKVETYDFNGAQQQSIAPSSGTRTLTKDAALELAKGYDNADVTYKSGMVNTKYTFEFGNLPEEQQSSIKSQYQDSAKTIASADVTGYRLSKEEIENLYTQYPDTVIKATGKAMEITFVQEESSGKVTNVLKTDENGYVIQTSAKAAGTYNGYEISITEKSTYIWAE